MSHRLALRTLLGAALLAAPAYAQSQSGEVRIAVVGPMTGPIASIGEQIRRGAEQAAEAINAAGGVGGKKIRVVVEDDGCDPKQAVAIANRVVSAGIHLVDGHTCSGSSIPAADVYGEAGVLMMTPSSSAPKLTDDAAARKVSTVMRLYGRDDAQGEFIGPWIAKDYGGKKIAILHDKSAYGKGLADTVRASLNKAGVKEAIYDGINPGEKDYTAIVSRLKSSGIDFVYFGGYHNEAGLMKRQAADQGYTFTLMMGDSLATPEYWQVAGPAGQGTLFTFPADARRRPEAKAVLDEFAKTKFQPEGFTLFSYAVVQALAEGVKRAGTDDGKAVAKALRQAPVDTVVGTVSFDAKGDIVHPAYDINVWKDGQYAPM